MIGAVDTGSTPYVGYLYVSPDLTIYADGLGPAGGSGTPVGALPLAVVYPDGRAIEYSYDTYLDMAMGRPTAVGDMLGDDANGGLSIPGLTLPNILHSNDWSGALPLTSTYLEQYTYLGLGTVVQTLRPETGGGLTYKSTNGSTSATTGDVYVGLDAFSRVAVQNWVDGNVTTTDGYAYTYDRDGSPSTGRGPARTTAGAGSRSSPVLSDSLAAVGLELVPDQRDRPTKEVGQQSPDEQCGLGDPDVPVRQHLQPFVGVQGDGPQHADLAAVPVAVLHHRRPRVRGNAH